jgi:hypothetical protein
MEYSFASGPYVLAFLEVSVYEFFFFFFFFIAIFTTNILSWDLVKFNMNL